MTVEEIQKALNAHAAWWRGEKEGVRANLSSANLSGADLRSANLRSANLSSANLRSADLPHRIVQFGPFGTVRQITTYDTKYDKVWSGCWEGTLAAFKLKVADKFPSDSEFGLLFTAGIAFFDAVAAVEKSSTKEAE